MSGKFVVRLTNLQRRALQEMLIEKALERESDFEWIDILTDEKTTIMEMLDVLGKAEVEEVITTYPTVDTRRNH
jgi:16S rRNA C967 or C1407 C5-methylase (RsmB/RsmF family)